MTPEQINALPAGRELDVLCAEKGMGWHRGSLDYWWRDSDNRPKERCKDCDDFQEVWSPSTNIAHAWQLVEKYDNKPYQFHVGVGWLDLYEDRTQIKGYVGDTFVLICRAVLCIHHKLI